MTKEQMIDKIYEVVANKEFSMWCKIVYTPLHTQGYYKTRTILSTKINSELLYIEKWYQYFTPEKISRDQITKVIWRPILIWDVLDWNEVNNWDMFDRYSWYLETIWKKKRLPIEEQSEECITYIYNLIKND